MNVSILAWVRVEKYCEMSGEPKNTVLDRIRDGYWAAGKHYKRTGQRTLWINTLEVDEWIAQQPHVEAAEQPRKPQSCQKASKSERMAA